MVGWKITGIVLLCIASVTSVPIIDNEQPPQLTVQDTDPESYDFLASTLEGKEVKFNDEDDEVEYRLPNNTIPLKYYLWLSTKVDQEIFEFSGRVRIHIRVLEPTLLVKLHARQLNIESISLVNEEGDILASPLLSNYDLQTEILLIVLPNEFATGDELFLHIEYNGILREDGSGFYRASYIDSDDKRVWFATTQFEMTDARHAMPCYDEPGLRAITSLSIQHYGAYTAISNMPVLSRESVEDDPDYVTTTFMDTPPMQSYLLAFIVSNYKYKSNNFVDVEQRIYAKPQAIDDGECDFALGEVDPMLRKLQEYFQVPYPLPKMDHALIRDYIWGAMENFGLITYQETSMLYVEGRDPVTRKKSIIELIGHEYVHQYFGNIINPKWWSYTWLNEGFATLFQYYISDLIYPESDHMERFQNNAQAAAFRVDVIASDSKPLNYYVETPENIRAKFSTISYQKGGSVLRMFQSAITDETFKKGLYYYLGEMYYTAATPQDLHRNLQTAYDEDFPGNGVDLDEVMTTWEEQAGYPLVNVQRTGSSITMTQTRYGGGNEIYTIPISYTTKSNPNFDDMTPKLWMSENTAAIPDFPTNDWIIVNLGLNGYYRVNYDASLWQSLIEGLKENHQMISAYHRKQAFIDMNPSTNTLADVTLAFELMSYLSAETDLTVWNTVSRVEGVFSKYLFGTMAHEQYNELILSIVQPHLTRLGWVERVGESEDDANLRNVVASYSCSALNQECLDVEHQKLLDFLAGTGSASFRVCEAVRNADGNTHKLLIDTMYVHDDKLNFIQNLGCSLNADILKNYLSIILDPFNGLSVGERAQILLYTYRHSATALQTTLEFIHENFGALDHVLGDSLKDQLLSMTSYINDNIYFDVYKRILSAMQAENFLTSAEVTTRTNAVNSNIEWVNSNWQSVAAYLNIQETTTTTTEATTTTGSPDSITTSTEGAETTTGASPSFIASLILIVACFVSNLLI
ncbi:CLUMA_CG015821, isoform A [Clunio marinus]|uniref:Aminopeptidase n=1 Tax=Clunio marinus TaxID=568069 RepID=A0A1J1IRH9_9DIPT|nr:CLUMA_CG015821, isoform A [Clunio marinus]